MIDIKKYGSAYVFTLIEGSGDGALEKIELRSRDKEPQHYEGSVSFIDNTNLRNSFSCTRAEDVPIKVLLPKECNAINIKKRRSSNPEGYSGVVYFPLIAYRTDTDSCADQWFLGVALSIHPQSMLIAKANVLPDGETMYISPFNLLLVNHVQSYSTDMTTKEKTKCSFSCRYLNRITEKTVCPLDMKLQCSVFGPDRIHISQLDRRVFSILESVQREQTVILSIPRFKDLTKNVATTYIPNINPCLSQRRTTTIHKAAKRMVTAGVVVNDHSNNNEKSKKDDKTFAIVYAKHYKADKNGDTYSQRCCIDIAHLTYDKVKKLLRSVQDETDGKMPIDEFNTFLEENKKYSTTMECHSIPADKKANGIAFEEKERTVVFPKEVRETKLFHQRSGDVKAIWKQVDERDGQVVMDRELLDYMFNVCYSRNFSQERDVAKCFGMNVYSGINGASYVRPTPRKGKSSILNSEKWRECQDPTFLPLILWVLNEMTKFTIDISKAIDPVYDDFQANVFSSTRVDGLHIQCNNTPGERFNSLQIITGPNKEVRGFANENHYDVNDHHRTQFDIYGKQLLRENMETCFKVLQHTSSTSDEKLRAIQSLNVISHLIKLGRYGGEDEDALSWSLKATCAYKVFFDSSHCRRLAVHFLYNDLGKAVKLPANKVVYQSWDARSIQHQTALPYTSDDDNVYLNDQHLCVLGWGCGKSQNRLWLEEAHPHTIPAGSGPLHINRLIQIAVENNIVPDVLQNTTLTQQRIDDWIQQHQHE